MIEDIESALGILDDIEDEFTPKKQALGQFSSKQALVCIGEYAIKTYLKKLPENPDRTLPIFVEKSGFDVDKWVPKGLGPHIVLGFENSQVNTHFWYSVLPYFAKCDPLERLDAKPNSSIMLASVWDGVSSASLPTLISKFKASQVNSLATAILPSKAQTSDAHFNSLASLKNCAAIEGSTVLLVERDMLESYAGVDRKGALMKGNSVANYLVQLMLDKEAFVSELSELSRTFNVNTFTVLLATGASYSIYGSVENMLDTALLNPLLTFDMKSASVLYVLVRMPSWLKEKLTRGNIELATANWFKEKAELKSLNVTEPIYVDEQNDRVDITLFLGGFDTKKMLTGLEQKVRALKSAAVKKGFIKGDDWQVILPSEGEKKVQEAKVQPPVGGVQKPEEAEKRLELERVLSVLENLEEQSELVGSTSAS